MNIKILKFLIIWLWIVLAPETALGGEIIRDTFFLRNSKAFSLHLDSFETLLKVIETDEFLNEKIKHHVLEEIDFIDRLRINRFMLSALPLEVRQISSLEMSETSARLKGLLDEMRSALEGFHKDLPNSSILRDRIKVVGKILVRLDDELIAIRNRSISMK